MSLVSGRLNAALLVLCLGVLGGCATAPAPQEVSAEAEALARQEALERRFDEAVEAMKNGDEDAAKALFEALHWEYPDHTGPLANMGILAMESGDPAQAKSHFQAVIAMDPEHVVALNHLGVIARESGEFEKAEAFYRDALAAEPDYLPAMMNLAILLDIYLGRPAEALPLYERYQSLAEEPNPRLKDWIFDVKNRI